MEKKKIRYEFYQFTSQPGGTLTKNLVLNNPSEVYFYVTSATTGRVVINNIWQLNSIKQYTLGTGNFNYELLLKNNENEIDVTDYNINILSANTSVFVKCKYYTDSK